MEISLEIDLEMKKMNIILFILKKGNLITTASNYLKENCR